jgi:hypothetical protein
VDAAVHVNVKIPSTVCFFLYENLHSKAIYFYTLSCLMYVYNLCMSCANIVDGLKRRVAWILGFVRSYFLYFS